MNKCYKCNKEFKDNNYIIDLHPGDKKICIKCLKPVNENQKIKREILLKRMENKNKK